MDEPTKLSDYLDQKYQNITDFTGICPGCRKKHPVKLFTHKFHEFKEKGSITLIDGQWTIEHLCPECEDRKYLEMVRSAYENSERKSKLWETCFGARYYRITEKYRHKWENTLKSKFFDNEILFNAFFVFTGGVGTGKTAELSCIAQWCETNRIGWEYAQLQDLLRQYKETRNNMQEQSPQKFIERFQQISVLLLDEITIQRGNDSDQECLISIIDYRFRHCLPTFFAGNIDRSDMENELLKTFGADRIVDRITADSNVVINFDGTSKRKKSA